MIRCLEPHEGALHRAVRLRALEDAPDSFADRFADISARPASYWQELTRSVTAGDRHVMFLACSDTAVSGSAYGLLDADAVIAWARGRGLTQLELWAPAHRASALRLYRAGGFSETGARRAMPGRPDVEIVEMRRDL